MSSSPVIDEAHRIAKLFEYPTEDVHRGVKEFIQQMDEGLEQDGATLRQIPSYVTAVPDGTEKGVYLAVDLGGTNFRVCCIDLHGDSTFSISQSKVAIPPELMVTRHGRELFSFLALQIEEFLRTHLSDHFAAHVERRQTGEVTDPYVDEQIFDMGFTFSFPVDQQGINKGKLIRWTKGFDIDQVIGQDVCKLLQDAIDQRQLPVRVAALVNDTVGTLMARSYCSGQHSKALIGAIFGTGTNGAYVEKLARIPKMDKVNPDTQYDRTTGEMVINVEWGSFDNHLSVLPNTRFDAALDADSVNPGIQMFEKRVSGMFLGEILRRALLAMSENPAVSLFRTTNDDAAMTIPPDSGLYRAWGIDTSFLSTVKADELLNLNATRAQLKQELQIDNASTDDCRAVKILVHAIGKRAARLSAVALAAVIISTGKLREGPDVLVDIGVDGSVVENYPGFEEYMRQAFREIAEIGEEGEKRITLGVAKDGSGVGAALGALVAREVARRS
ncbi:glucokinase glkA [Histoplasma capsulatum var. duboisii H88]|uniref:Phosphotransferase n=1 Tax=Ajellomyces capsulatus (strain H88) TaxID=544711 RepID=F0UT42_AJEC8|nr:glucokinase glkA [Histoplasma capsulatum var. duboisii H88]QSS54661.1 glucokinase glkA [Histoplasma capsulatum var. duboisii H88]